MSFSVPVSIYCLFSLSPPREFASESAHSLFSSVILAASFSPLAWRQTNDRQYRQFSHSDHSTGLLRGDHLQSLRFFAKLMFISKRRNASDKWSSKRITNAFILFRVLI